MWTRYFTLFLMAALLRMGYELTRKETVSTDPSPRQDAADDLTTMQRVWADRAVKRYAEAQEKKWRNWNEAMFEAK